MDEKIKIRIQILLNFQEKLENDLQKHHSLG